MNSYHLRCLGPAAADVKCAELYKCPYCRYLVDGSSSLKGAGPLVRLLLNDLRFVGKRSSGTSTVSISLFLFLAEIFREASGA